MIVVKKPERNSCTNDVDNNESFEYKELINLMKRINHEFYTYIIQGNLIL